MPLPAVTTVFDCRKEERVYKTHPNFRRANQERKKKEHIKRDKIDIRNIINDIIFNLHNNLLKRYVTVTFKV